MHNSDRQAQWLRSLDARPSSATVILENAQGEALIVKAHYKPHWTFPGGIIDEDESPAEAAIREVAEEVGLTIDPMTLRFAWVAHRTSEVINSYQFVFYGALPAGAEASIVLQASEIDEHAWVSKADVLSGDRHYGKVIEHWARGASGYVEQSFGPQRP